VIGVAGKWDKGLDFKETLKKTASIQEVVEELPGNDRDQEGAVTKR
jgi:hypothetical protein